MTEDDEAALDHIERAIAKLNADPVLASCAPIDYRALLVKYVRSVAELDVEDWALPEARARSEAMLTPAEWAEIERLSKGTDR